MFEMNKRGGMGLAPLFYVVTVGFVLLQVASLVASEFFDKDPIKVGPMLLGVILIGAAWGALGIVNRFFTGGIETQDKKAARGIVFLVLVAAAILYLLYTYVPTFASEFFVMAP
jgi:hypothetical protein